MAEQSTNQRDSDHNNSYPENAMKATPALETIISQEIHTSGPLPFSKFMEMALYHPQHGYYSRPQQKTGKQGDFITSVSVGSCFGTILADRIHAYWQASGKPPSFAIIEPGAHDGSLAKDILDATACRHPDFFDAIHYHLVECSPSLTEQQYKKLQPHYPGKLSQHSELNSIHEAHGTVISNELIDAFPVELIRYNGTHWEMLSVTQADNATLTIEPSSTNTSSIADPALRDFCRQLGENYPKGYTTEYNTGLTNFTRSAAKVIEKGLFITIDYGHTQADYYHPDRSTGTLQTYQNHQKSDDPLTSPGNCDITAHVDFTRLQQNFTIAGLHSPWFGTQARFLTEHARTLLLSMETDPHPSDSKVIKQFQTLTHPSMLGSRFLVLEMQK